MIFFSINQVYSFLLIFTSGVICGLILAFFKVFLLNNYQKNIFNYFFKIFSTIIFSFFIIFSINLFYYGDFKPIPILAFILGYFCLNKTLSNSLDFLQTKFYYIYIKIMKGVKKHFAGKHKSIQD